ncbi:multidrug transporter [Oceanicola sp. 22II-s10i]|uniref:MFS transporter n=1 Tax=Oceanicola sp. 22II-s10i TaxID=1317116 RepID=UPI000B523362|nr:MFS transporter [Oceanicola sp. 22II-s10i]OWU82329.1 multidrug transporter [Oceanicola sp. 22II-s10i]
MRLSPLALLIAAIAVVGAVSMVLAPITAAVAADLGVAPVAVVRAGAAFGLATMFSALFLAPRGDAIGADRALMQALVVQIVGLGLSAAAPGVVWLALAQAIAGVGSGMALPAIYGLAPQVVPKGQENRAVGKVLSGWVVALTAGVAGSGFVAEYLGWRTVYATFFALDLVVLLLLRRLSLEVSRGQPTSPLTALKVPGIWPALFGAFCMMLSFYGTYAFLGAHVGDVLGRGADGAGWVTLCYGTGFGLSLLLDNMLDRLPRRVAGALSMGGLALTYGAMAVTGSGYTALLFIALFWGITQHAALNFAISRLAALDIRQRGAVLGLNSAQTYLAVMLGALAFQWPYAAGGFAACAAGSCALALAGAVEATRIRG